MDAQPGKLAQAASWYLDAVDAVPAEGWKNPTLCEAWTVSNVVAHVATGDQLFHARILDAMGKDRAGQDLPVDTADQDAVLHGRSLIERVSSDRNSLEKIWRERLAL